jgi:hypothetical protein
MDPLSVVASAAGLVIFAGEAITGLSKLISVVENIKNRDKKIEDLLRDLVSLREVLRSVKILMIREGSELPYGLGKDIASGLGNAINDCARDITEISGELNGDIDSSKWVRFFRMAKSAIDQCPFEKSGRTLSSHYQKVHLHLELYKRYAPL